MTPSDIDRYRVTLARTLGEHSDELYPILKDGRIVRWWSRWLGELRAGEAW